MIEPSARFATPTQYGLKWGFEHAITPSASVSASSIRNARSMSSGSLQGLVGSSSRTRSYSDDSSCSTADTAWARTGIIGVESEANDDGLMNGTSAPDSLALAAISSLSVETTTRVICGTIAAQRNE